MIRRIAARIPWLETMFFVAAVATLAAIVVTQQAPPIALDSYSSYDASAGGYRAFYVLLQRERLPVERFERRPLFLDSSIATLVYAEPLPFDPSQGPSSEADASAIELWVKAGGTLVYFGHDDAAAKAGLLRLPSATAAAARPHAAFVSTQLRDAGVRSLGTVASSLRWKLPPAKARVRALYDDGRGPVTIAYRFGRGTVVATIDETLLDNQGLARADRARLALALVDAAPAGATIWFDEAIHGYLVPEHWWSIVPVPFVIATIVAVLALLIAIAGAALRFGPPIVPPPRDDRTSADFIDALSTLLERGKASGKATADAVRSSSAMVARSLGLAAGAPPAEILARIDDQERRADFETMLTLANDPARSGTAFVRAVALAQRLRKDAVSHGR